MNDDDARTMTAALGRIAAGSRPARLPADLWSRGRRRHRLTVAATVTTIALVVLALVAVTLPVVVRRPIPPAEPVPAVPSRVDLPLPGQAAAVDAPPGPASLVVSAPGGLGYRGFSAYEDRALVVGRNGSYRMVRHINAFDAGTTLLLSPDGRLLAGDGGFEGLPATSAGPVTVVLDLTTGQTRIYPGGQPVAWSPDGRKLVVQYDLGRLRLLDLATGALLELGTFAFDTTIVAFAPDGRQLAVQATSGVVLVDLATGTPRPLVNLDFDRQLAGPGAWDRSGRLAVWHLTARGPSEHDYELSYVDARDGTPVAGPVPPAVRATGLRLLGWTNAGDAIAVSGGAHAQIVALHPDGRPLSTAVDLPGSVNGVDLAVDQLDHLGGPPPSLGDRWLDWVRPLLGYILALVGIILLTFGLVRLRRRLRTGSWRRPLGARRPIDFPRRF